MSEFAYNPIRMSLVLNYCWYMKAVHLVLTKFDNTKYSLIHINREMPFKSEQPHGQANQVVIIQLFLSLQWGESVGSSSSISIFSMVIMSFTPGFAFICHLHAVNGLTQGSTFFSRTRRYSLYHILDNRLGHAISNPKL